MMETKTLITFEQVQAAVAESLGMEPEDVTINDSFVSLGADSMDTAQLIVDLEEALGVELPDDDMQKFMTVKGLIEYANDPRSKRS
jgi:acyl carrier protein